MKLLFIIQRLQLRGAEIFACQLASELQIKGVTVDLVYLFPGSLGLKEQFPGLSFIPLNADPARRLWDIPAYKRLSQLIHRERYTIVQANAGDTLKYAVLSRTIFSWKAILIFRNASKMSAFIRNAFHLYLNRWFLKRCDYYISVSENCRQDLIVLYNRASELSTTITIGTYSFDEVQPIENHRTNHDPVIVNVASLVREKNHKFLIELFFKYFQRHQSGYLWLVGDGKNRDMLEKQVVHLGLENRVRFWGYRKDALAILKSADVLVIPSLVEGLPGVILEALSCGIPVIASKVGGIPEVIEDGITGYCIPSFDPDLYVSKLEEILSSPELAHAIIKNGKKLVNEKFLMSGIAQAFLKTYQKLATTNPE